MMRPHYSLTSCIDRWRAVRYPLALALIGLLALDGAQAQARFAVTELSALAGAGSPSAAAINMGGQIVGSGAVSSFNQTALLWSNGQVRALGKLAGGNYSFATAVNSFGVAVGDGDTGNFRPQSWVATPKGLLNIFPNNGGNTHVVGINDAGAICGYYTKSLSGSPSSWSGAVWTPDPKDPTRYRMTNLPRVVGINPKVAFALPGAFNQAGQAAGYLSNDVVGQHAALWNNDAAHSIVDLGTLPGDTNSYAYGMNDLGQVVGMSYHPYADTPVLWNNDAAHTPVALPLLPGDVDGQAFAINRAGQILGMSGPYGGPYHYVLWTNGQVIDLQATLASAGWRIGAVTAINDAGQIVGSGTHNGLARAFVLTSIP